MPDDPAPQSAMILYQTEGRTRIQCRFENESLWLTQAQIAELFQTTPQNVTLHLKAIFAEGELSEAATCKDYLQVRQEGARAVSRSPRHYRLEAILAVGYRVRSHAVRAGRAGGVEEVASFDDKRPKSGKTSKTGVLAMST